MKTVLASLALVFALAGSAQAQNLIGGERQAYDRDHCAIYRTTWAEDDRPIDVPRLGVIGTLKFGPEAPIAYFLNQSGLAPDQLAVTKDANDRYAHLLHLNGKYRGYVHLPSIGYDQFYAAASIVALEPILQDRTGPFVMPPSFQGYDFSDWQTNPETKRLMEVAGLLHQLSLRRVHTQDQLDRIEAYLRETPTCNGVPYPAE